MTTAIQLKPSNFQDIALRTQNISVSDLELAYESAPSGTWYIVRDYVDLSGRPINTWMTISQEWLDQYFTYDKDKIKTQYIPITRLKTPKVAV